MFISFALGNDWSLRCVTGLPTLLYLGNLIDLFKDKFVCSRVNRSFPLTLDPPGKELLEGVVFDNSTSTIPYGVVTKIIPDPSLSCYTPSEDYALSSSSTSYSDNIIVYDKLFQGNMSRNIEYILNWKIVRGVDITTETKSSELPRVNSSESIS